MKHYCFATKEVGRRGKVKGRVWRIKNNKLEPITSFEFYYGSTRGAIHEAFIALMDCGEIPKKWWNSSCSSRCGAGYFYGKVTEIYNIQEVYV